MPSRTGAVRFSRSITLDDAQRVLVVAEAAAEALASRAVEHLLADVPERRVPEVVAEPDRLREVLVEPQRARHRARDLRRLERVRQPRAVVVALGRDEDLGLVLEPAERLAVHDPVAVALERRAQPAVLLAPLAVGRVGAGGAGASASSSQARMRASKAGSVTDALTPSHSDAPRGRVRRRTRSFGAEARCQVCTCHIRVWHVQTWHSDGAQAQVRVVLERLQDRPLRLRERARRRVRRVGQRASERADEEVVRLLAERERARLAGRADDAARGAREAGEVLAARRSRRRRRAAARSRRRAAA